MSAYEIQSFFLSPLSSGLIFALLVLGVFIAYRVLDIADLSVEGVFPLVTVLSCFLILRNVNPFLVVLIVLVLGVVAGIINACLSIYLKIPPLLSGIIVMTFCFALLPNESDGPLDESEKTPLTPDIQGRFRDAIGPFAAGNQKIIQAAENELIIANFDMIESAQAITFSLRVIDAVDRALSGYKRKGMVSITYPSLTGWAEVKSL